MEDSKRQYLKYAGAGLAAASLGIGGTVASGSGALSSVEGATDVAPQSSRPTSGDRLDYERRGNDIEFDYLDLAFESDDGDIDLDDVGVDFETDGESLELTIDNGDVSLDLEMDMENGAADVELTLSVGGEYVDFESSGRGTTQDVEFEAIGDSETFEDDNREIEYKGDAIGFEWDTESQELDITGDVALELKTDGELDFEYQDDLVTIDYDTSELEYVGEEVSLEWEFGDGDDDEFEARRL
jgi:hypothetical protein